MADCLFIFLAFRTIVFLPGNRCGRVGMICAASYFAVITGKMPAYV